MTEAISMELKRIGVGDIVVTECGELEVYEGCWVHEPNSKIEVDAAGRIRGDKMAIRFSVQTARGSDNFHGYIFPATGKLVSVNKNRISAPIEFTVDLPPTVMVRPRDPTLQTSECMCGM